MAGRRETDAPERIDQAIRRMVSELLMDSDVFNDLVIALLSVNGYRVEKTRPLQHALEQAGLFDLKAVGNLREDEVADRLRVAGYNRGEFLTRLMAARLVALSQYLCSLGWKAARELLESGN